MINHQEAIWTKDTLCAQLHSVISTFIAACDWNLSISCFSIHVTMQFIDQLIIASTSEKKCLWNPNKKGFFAFEQQMSVCR